MVLPTTISILGVTFHLYGLVLGLALVIGLTLIEKKYKQLGFSQQFFPVIILSAVFGGVIGARLWHVVTDWTLYRDNWLAAVYIWRGGLSILGAVAGGILALFTVIRLTHGRSTALIPTIWHSLDLLIFGLPVAQAFGRIGNYINQELYGMPTELPWGIYIDPAHRLSEYIDFAYYHPLFLYEALATGLFAAVLYVFDSKKKLPKVGSGALFGSYLLFYSGVRFCLDFVRLQKATVLWGLGFNQVILLAIVVIFATYLLLADWRKSVGASVRATGAVFLAFLLLVLTFLNVGNLTSGSSMTADIKSEKQQQIIVVGAQELSVEVVRTPEEITLGLGNRDQLGADGMLFVFDQSRQAWFWMKNMRFDIDIVWIYQGKVINITQNVPHPRATTPDSELPLYSSGVAVDMVLELVAGDALRRGITVGSAVTMR